MKAVVFDRCGEPSQVLRTEDRPVAEPTRGEVLVRMLATPVNPSDLLYVRGQYTLQPRLPASPGFEGVGVVERAGGGLRPRIMLGKRVAVLSRMGGNWAENNIVPATQVIPISRQLSLEAAATFFVNPATAYIMTRLVLRVSPGEWLLQTAAGSTLGLMIARLGKRFGFRTLCVVRKEADVEPLLQSGATRVVVYDAARDTPDVLVQAVMESTAGNGVQYAVDPVGGACGSTVTTCLAERGRMLVFGSLSGAPLQFSPRDLMTPGASISGFWLGHFMQQQSLTKKLRLVRTITRLIMEGILSSRIAAKFPLHDVCHAVESAEQRSGKTLLQIQEH